MSIKIKIYLFPKTSSQLIFFGGGGYEPGVMYIVNGISPVNCFSSKIVEKAELS
jgi:hypothetical protein